MFQNDKYPQGAREQSLCHPELCLTAFAKILDFEQNVPIRAESQTVTSYSLNTLFPRPLKRAFTLAEVLITLGIIGIVASMTLPALVAKYQKKVMVTQLKRVYRDLGEAIKRSEVDNGELKYWDYTIPSKEFFDKYLTSYLKIGKHKVGDVRADGIYYYQISGRQETDLIGMYNSANIIDVYSGYQIFLGESSHNPDKQFVDFFIDVNGFKGPNTFGKDIHSFKLFKDQGLRPFSNGDWINRPDTADRNKLLNGPNPENYQCNSSGRGMWCTAVIMMDGWEIKDDYPW